MRIKDGWSLLPKRWVVERTFAWLNHFRRLAKDYEIAVKSALTGHFVLTTLHSRNALTVIQRLKNLGISADLLSETLNLIVSQKLVRRLCQHYQEGKTCRNCRGTGYRGRKPLYEILEMNQSLREPIHEKLTGVD